MDGAFTDTLAASLKKAARPELRVHRRLLLRSMIRAECRALRTAPCSAIIISPYLTSRTAEMVIGGADPATCLVLTTFDAETFATGSSSLRTLRKLIQNGFTIRAVDNLHAKVLISGNDVFIGSQNLTARGGTNLEATVHLIDDEKAVCELREESERWSAESRVITLAMIGDMEQAIAPLEKLAAELHEKAAALDEEISRKERERREAELRALLEAERRREELERQVAITAAKAAHAALQRAVEVTQAARTRVFLTLREMSSGYSGTYWTLAASSKVDMTELAFGPDGEDHRFKPRNRYLLIVPEIGRLGWPALNRTRFTVFGTGLDRTDMKFDVLGKPCRVSIDLNQDIATLPIWNVKFRLYQQTQRIGIDIKARFKLDGFEIAEVTDDPSGWLARSQLAELACDPASDLTAALRSSLLQPFKYKENSRDDLATEFCSGLGYRFTLKWRLFQNYPFFAMERR